MGRIKTNRIKTILTVTDPCGTKMFLLEFVDQAGRVIKINSKDGMAAAIYMDDKALGKLQRCLNKMFPPKIKHVRIKKVEKAIRMKTAYEENIKRFDEILQSVCSQMDLIPRAVVSSRRFRELTAARMITGYLARKYTRMSYPDLAGLFNEKTHASVLIRVRKYEEQCDKRKYNGRTLGAIASRVEELLGLK